MSDVREVRVGLATCGIAAGAERVAARFRNDLDSGRIDVPIKRVGCIGMCYNEPLVDVVDESGALTTYGHVTEADVERIVAEHVLGGSIIEELRVAPDAFFANQVRIVLENCGVIDPESLDEYRAHEGYVALKTVLEEMEPEDVVEVVEPSGLRGIPRRPSIDAISAVSSPQTNAPAPALIRMSNENEVPKMLSPSKWAARASSSAFSSRRMASGYSART